MAVTVSDHIPFLTSAVERNRAGTLAASGELFKLPNLRFINVFAV